MKFYTLPTRLADASVHMADDLAMLGDFPFPSTIRFRHYEWATPCWTFGYSQGFKNVLQTIGNPGSVIICRRPTGGGLVHHVRDWTYSLVIPPNHPAYSLPAKDSYRLVHNALTRALIELNVPAYIKECEGACTAKSAHPAASQCFKEPVTYDVVHSDSSDKIAGAAQKRTKKGLLIQGTIFKPAAGNISWTVFREVFTMTLADELHAVPEDIPWPHYCSQAVSQKRHETQRCNWNTKR